MNFENGNRERFLIFFYRKKKFLKNFLYSLIINSWVWQAQKGLVQCQASRRVGRCTLNHSISNSPPVLEMLITLTRVWLGANLGESGEKPVEKGKGGGSVGEGKWLITWEEFNNHRRQIQMSRSFTVIIIFHW